MTSAFNLAAIAAAAGLASVVPAAAQTALPELAAASSGASIVPAAGTAAPAARVFNTITVTGNSRFSARDVIATSGLQAGTVMGQQDLQAAVDALQYTAEFERVVITSAGDTLNIEVEETAGYSGGLTFGAGYDTDRGLFGAAGITLDGALGAGTTASLNLSYSEPVQTLRFDLRSPQFWPGEIAGGLRGGYENFQYSDVTYNFSRASIEPYLALDLGGTAALELRYTLSMADIYNVDAGASPIIAAEAGREVSSGIGFSLGSSSAKFGSGAGVFDRWSVRFDQDITGLGGDTKTSTSQLTLSARAPIAQSGFALRTRIEAGAVVGFGGDAPRASDRFSLGGSRLRGFARGAVAPIDVCAGCGAGGADQNTVLGGNTFVAARTDLLVPLFRDRPEIETFVFFDIGSAWGLDTGTAPAGTLHDGLSWRSSAGLGVSFDTPLGSFEAFYAPYADGLGTDAKQEFGLTLRADF